VSVTSVTLDGIPPRAKERQMPYEIAYCHLPLGTVERAPP